MFRSPWIICYYLGWVCWQIFHLDFDAFFFSSDLILFTTSMEEERRRPSMSTGIKAESWRARLSKREFHHRRRSKEQQTLRWKPSTISNWNEVKSMNFIDSSMGLSSSFFYRAGEEWLADAFVVVQFAARSPSTGISPVWSIAIRRIATNNNDETTQANCWTSKRLLVAMWSRTFNSLGPMRCISYHLSSSQLFQGRSMNLRYSLFLPLSHNDSD